MAKLSSHDRDSMGYKAKKYLLYGLFQKRLGDPRFKGEHKHNEKKTGKYKKITKWNL